MDEDDTSSASNCLFCYRQLGANCIEDRSLEKQSVVYQSCCKLINKEDLGENFFKWSQSASLPFCDDCLSWAQKISLLNAKLEELEGKIGKCVQKFTSLFLREREACLSGTVNPFPFESAGDYVEADLIEGPELRNSEGVPFSRKLLRRSEEEDGDDDEENNHSFLKSENAVDDDITVKKEFGDFDQANDSDNHFDSFLSNDNDYLDTKPIIEKLKVRPVGRPRKAKNSSKLKKSSKAKDKSKKKAKNEFEYLERRMSSRSSLPHRTAALKAVKSFISNNDRSDDDEDIQSSISEELSVASNSGSEDEYGRGRRLRKRRSKRKKTISKVPGNRFKCKYCKMEFEKKVELRRHLPSHDEDRPFKCTKCTLRFTTEKFLAIHSWKHFSEKLFKCAHCEHSYKYMHCLKDHVKNQKHHEELTEPCEECEEAITQGKELLQQKKIECGYLPSSYASEKKEKRRKLDNPEERPFGCDKCPLRFTTEKFLKIHAWKHFSEKFFKCGHCENTYKYMHCLKDHVKNQGHHKDIDENEVPCLVCEEAIKVGKDLLNQKKIENGFIPSEYGNNSTILKEIRKKYKVKEPKEVVRKKRPKIIHTCPECSKTLPGKGELFYHRYSHQPPGTELKCEDCEEIFTDALSHQKHTVEIHPKAPDPPKESLLTQCPVCGKVLRGNINRHMYLHSEVKQFPCPTCGKRFSTKKSMKLHTAIHQQHRPYLCEECGQGFYTGTKLREHYRIHTGMLLFCEHCPKGFRNSTHLKQHMRSHNKEGRKSQPVFTVTEKIDEQAQIEAVAEMKVITEIMPPLPFQCGFCGLYFESEGHLSIHVIEHTRNDYQQ